MILYIKSGIVNKMAVKRFFETLKDGRYELKAERLNKRSSQQNRYLWGCVYEYVLQGLKDAGFDAVQTKEDCHMICKNLFLKIQKPDKDGVVLEIFRSTSSLSKTEMMEYIDRVCQWAAEYLNVAIPLPNEQSELY